LAALLGAGHTAHADDALRRALAGWPEDGAPVRLHVTATLPPSRVREGLTALQRLPRVEEVLEGVLSQAACVVVADEAAPNAPLVELAIRGTDTLGKQEGARLAGGTAGAARPLLIAEIEGTLTITGPQGRWVRGFRGRAVQRLATESAALKSDAPFGAALTESPLLSVLDEVVRLRNGSRIDALLAAVDSGWYAGWSVAALKLLEGFEPEATARTLVDRFIVDAEGLGEAASVLLPFLGAPAVDALLATPEAGGTGYRWRRLTAARDLAERQGPNAGLAEILRRGLTDGATVVRTSAVDAVAAIEGKSAAPLLLEALRDAHASVREHAREALMELSGEKHDADPERWRAWVKKQDAAAAPAAVRALSAPLFPFGVRPVRGSPPAAGARANDPLSGPLASLVALQRPDGSWPAADDGWTLAVPGVTGLAILALLGAGHSTVEGDPYAGPLRRGLAYLGGDQDEEGFIGPRVPHAVASHGLATLALVEGWAADASPEVLGWARKALAHIYVARNPYFVWRYGVKPGDNDTFVTICMAQAIEAAERCNAAAAWAKAPPIFVLDAEAQDGIRAWVNKMTDPDYGWVGYISRGGPPGRYVGEAGGPASKSDHAPTITAGAVLLRLMLGDPPKSDPVVKALPLIAPELPAWPGSEPQADLLRWWYGSLVFARLPKDPRAKPWEKALTAAATSALADPRLQERTRFGWIGGEAFARALAVLCLVAGSARTALEADRRDLARTAADAKAPPNLRAAALRAFARGAPAKAAPIAAAWVAEGNAPLRRAALDVLAALPTDAVAHAPTLLPHLKHASEDVRATAVEALAPLGRSSEPARLAVIASLDDASARVRTAAAVGSGGNMPAYAAALPALRTRLADADPGVMLSALGALRLAKAPVEAAALRPLLAHASAEIRRAGASSLDGAEGPPAERFAMLDKARVDPDPAVRAAAARALGGLPGAPSATALEGMLSDTEDAVGRAAAAGLARLAVSTPEVLTKLGGALSANDARVRRRAAQALSLVGPAARVADGAMHEAIKAEIRKGDEWDAAMLFALAEAQWRVRGDSVATASILQGLLTQSRDAEVRLGAVDLLGAMPEAGVWANRQLLEGIDERGPMLVAVLDAFADQGSPGRDQIPVVEWVLRVYRHDPDVRRHAEIALRRLRGE
jgi:HEAT repeat protein